MRGRVTCGENIAIPIDDSIPRHAGFFWEGKGGGYRGGCLMLRKSSRKQTTVIQSLFFPFQEVCQGNATGKEKFKTVGPTQRFRSRDLKKENKKDKETSTFLRFYIESESFSHSKILEHPVLCTDEGTVIFNYLTRIMRIKKIKLS